MKPDRIGSVWRSRCEDPGQRSFRIAPRVYLKYVALRSVEPCDHYDFVARPDAQQSIGHIRGYFDPCLRSAFVALAGRSVAIR